MDQKIVRKYHLPWLEVNFYFCSWIFGIAYSSYRVYLIGNERNILYYFEKDLVNGWPLLNRWKDAGDHEWGIWIEFITNFLTPYIIFNYFGACIVNVINPKFLPLWYFSVTSFCLTSRYGIRISMILFLQPLLFAGTLFLRKSSLLISSFSCIMYYLSFHDEVVAILKTHERYLKNTFQIPKYHFDSYYFFIMQSLVFVVTAINRKSRLLIWVFFGFIYYMFVYKEIIAVPPKDLSMLIPALMWIFLRCLSFSLDEIDKNMTWKSLYTCLGYVFHLPCFFMGPIILYQPFKRQVYCKSKINILKSVQFLIMNNIRYILWMYMMEFLLHFIYINYILKHIQYYTTDEHSVWIMYGIGFNMGLFFFLKYTVIYGLALTWTRAEGYETPNPPKCIARIALYSDMWRLFDEGLYLFIRKYIFEPISNFIRPKLEQIYYLRSFSILISKIVSSLFCFIFVFLWHGLEYWVFVWSFLNFIGILLEILASQISKTDSYLYVKNVLGLRNEQRLIGVICAPLTIVSAISNFYFLGGSLVAETYFNYIFRSNVISNTLYLWFFVYCLCQLSMEYKKNYRR